MTLTNLSRFISKEDFADAHEPLNDGVKEVPNAQTVAASVKTQDVGKDTTNAGPAKIIPEQEDTDDVTEKQFDTVSESEEKGTTTETSTDETSTETKTVDEPLEHDTKEDAETEQKKVEKATTALESYAPHAARFDIIGYPSRDKERLAKTVGYLSRTRGKVTLSCESINQAIASGKERLVKLEKQIRAHETRQVAKENFDPVVEEVITDAPTEHGSTPLPAPVAEELTEREIMPGDTEVEEIVRINDALDTLQDAQVAIENYRTIIRSNGRISKQAAAILHTGLEAIDQRCGLAVRSTGLEGYDTSPKAAMEDADVDEKTLDKRSSQIGAKILSFVKKLYEKGTVVWQQLSTGATKLDNALEHIVDESNTLRQAEPKEEAVEIKSLSPLLYFNGEFTGAKISTGEDEAVQFIQKVVGQIYQEAAYPIARALHGEPNGFDKFYQRLADIETQEIAIPGGSYTNQGAAIKFNAADSGETPNAEDVKPRTPVELKQQADKLRKHIKRLTGDGAIEHLNKGNNELVKAFAAYRKRNADQPESEFQSMQSEIVKNVINPMTPAHYSDLIRPLLRVTAAKVAFLRQMISIYK